MEIKTGVIIDGKNLLALKLKIYVQTIPMCQTYLQVYKSSILKKDLFEVKDVDSKKILVKHQQ